MLAPVGTGALALLHDGLQLAAFQLSREEKSILVLSCFYGLKLFAPALLARCNFGTAFSWGLAYPVLSVLFDTVLYFSYYFYLPLPPMALAKLLALLARFWPYFGAFFLFQIVFFSPAWNNLASCDMASSLIFMIFYFKAIHLGILSAGGGGRNAWMLVAPLALLLCFFDASLILAVGIFYWGSEQFFREVYMSRFKDFSQTLVGLMNFVDIFPSITGAKIPIADFVNHVRTDKLSIAIWEATLIAASIQYLLAFLPMPFLFSWWRNGCLLGAALVLLLVRVSFPPTKRTGALSAGGGAGETAYRKVHQLKNDFKELGGYSSLPSDKSALQVGLAYVKGLLLALLSPPFLVMGVSLFLHFSLKTVSCDFVALLALNIYWYEPNRAKKALALAAYSASLLLLERGSAIYYRLLSLALCAFIHAYILFYRHDSSSIYLLYQVLVALGASPYEGPLEELPYSFDVLFLILGTYFDLFWFSLIRGCLYVPLLNVALKLQRNGSMKLSVTMGESPKTTEEHYGKTEDSVLKAVVEDLRIDLKALQPAS